MGRRGVSLPIVIIFMAILALAVTVGLARVSDERRIVADQQANMDAFAVALSGIERYVALTDTAPGLFDSVAIRVGTRDTAFVVIYRIQPPIGGRALYLLRSRGVSHSARRFDAITPPAQRIVAQYATLETPVDIDAAWTSLSGLRSLGNQGVINGFDECSTPSANVAGVAVPDRLYTPPAQFNEGFGAPPNPTGNPPIMILGGSGSHPDDARSYVHIDWNEIKNGTILNPDYLPTSPGTWPVAADWSVIRVNGDISLGAAQSGRGLIVVTDSLELTGGFTWEGLILVGKQLAVTGSTPAPARVRGAMISGLDVKLSTPPYFSESNSGTSGSDRIDVRYNSGHVRRAVARYARLSLLANAWTESWPQS